MDNLMLPNLEWISQTFPILTSGQLNDRDVLVHSLGCSIWNTYGHEQGYMAVVECPAPNSSGADIRSDSGWFIMHETQPFCLVEFERYDGKARSHSNLITKLKNLLEAAQRWNNYPSQVILSAWSRGLVDAPDINYLRNVCKLGFKSANGAFIKFNSNLKVIFSYFLFTEQHSKIVLSNIKNEMLV